VLLLVALGLAGLALIAVYHWLDVSTAADRAAVGRGPEPNTLPSEAVVADLSALGLTMAPPHDARADPTWSRPEWRYLEGSVADYHRGQGPAVSVWALKYADHETAGDDFNKVADYEFRACGQYLRFGDVISCSYNNGHEKLFLLGAWIVNIATWQAPGATSADISVDAVRDALVAQWREGPRQSSSMDPA
jgi:hypothetical protein